MPPVWDEEAAPPVEPTTELTEQPATTETEQPDTSITEPPESPASVEAASSATDEAVGQDEDIREDVPLAEIDTRFSNSPKGARAYISKLTQRLDDARDSIEFNQKFLGSTPGDTLLDELETKSKSRHDDLGWAYYNRYKAYFTTADPKIGMPYDELVALVEKNRTGTTDAPRDTAEPPHNLNPEDLEDDEQYLSPRLRAKLAKYDELEKEFPQVKERLTKFEQEHEKTTQTTEKQEQDTIREGFFTSVFSHADEHLQERIGLKALDGDSEEVKAYIESTNKTLKARLIDELAERKEYDDDANAIGDAITRRDKSRVSSFLPKAKTAAEIVLSDMAAPYLPALKAMRSPAKQVTQKRPEITGSSAATAPPNSLPRGKGVDAVWDAA